MISLFSKKDESVNFDEVFGADVISNPKLLRRNEIDKRIKKLKTTSKSSDINTQIMYREMINLLEKLADFKKNADVNKIKNNTEEAKRINDEMSELIKQFAAFRKIYSDDEKMKAVIDYCAASLTKGFNKLTTQDLFSAVIPSIPADSAEFIFIGELGRGNFGVVKKYQVSGALLEKFIALGFCDRPLSGESAYVVVKELTTANKVALQQEGERGGIVWEKALKKQRRGKQTVCNVSANTKIGDQDVVVCRYEAGSSFAKYVKELDRHPEAHVRRDELLAQVFNDLFQNMLFLHKNGILHLDIADRNIVMTADGHAVLIDLGLAEYFDKESVKILKRNEGPIKWMDNLLLLRQVASEYSDLYSLKITMLQLMAQAAGVEDLKTFRYGIEEKCSVFTPLIKADKSFDVHKKLEMGDAGTIGYLMTILEQHLDANTADPRCQEVKNCLNHYRAFIKIDPIASEVAMDVDNPAQFRNAVDAHIEAAKQTLAAANASFEFTPKPVDTAVSSIRITPATELQSSAYGPMAIGLAETDHATENVVAENADHAFEIDETVVANLRENYGRTVPAPSTDGTVPDVAQNHYGAVRVVDGIINPGRQNKTTNEYSPMSVPETVEGNELPSIDNPHTLFARPNTPPIVPPRPPGLVAYPRPQRPLTPDVNMGRLGNGDGNNGQATMRRVTI